MRCSLPTGPRCWHRICLRLPGGLPCFLLSATSGGGSVCIANAGTDSARAILVTPAEMLERFFTRQLERAHFGVDRQQAFLHTDCTEILVNRGARLPDGKIRRGIYFRDQPYHVASRRINIDPPVVGGQNPR